MKNKTVSDCTPAENINKLGGGTEIIIEDRSNDPEIQRAGIKELKKFGISGNWKVIRKNPAVSS